MVPGLIPPAPPNGEEEGWFPPQYRQAALTREALLGCRVD